MINELIQEINELNNMIKDLQIVNNSANLHVNYCSVIISSIELHKAVLKQKVKQLNDELNREA